MRFLLTAAMLAACPLPVLAGETSFVIGSRPYNFADRSRESHITMHMRGPDWPNGRSNNPDGGNRSPAGGDPGYLGYPVNSQAYSIGNWVQVDMNLAADAEGLIMIENHQDSSGDQQAVSDALGSVMDTYQADDPPAQ